MGWTKEKQLKYPESWERTKKKIVKSLIFYKNGNVPWNKGKTGIKTSNKGQISPMKGKKHTEETKRKMSETSKKVGKGKWTKGRITSEETRKKISEANFKRFKNPENHPRWQGGKTPAGTKIRNSKEYVIWRKSVFERDDWTCIWCGIKGGKLNADHIKPFALFPELRLAIDNGRTLCETCHKTTDSYLNRWHKE